MIQTRPFDVDDFSGGITDNYIGAEQNQAQRADNVLIQANKKLITRPGSEIFDADYAQLPTGNQRIGRLFNYDKDTELLAQSAKKIYEYDATTGWGEIAGTNAALTAGSTTSVVSFAEWNKHLLVTNDDWAPVSKIYKDSGGTMRVRTAGLPWMDGTAPSGSAPTVTPTAGADSYIYGFLYHYTYTVGSKTFEDFGPVTYVQVASMAAPTGGSPATFGAFPTITNGATYNYDTAAITVFVYRTVANGTVLYKQGSYALATIAGSTDTVTDATIQNNELLYTTGGVVDNAPPPLAKILHVVHNFALYAHIKEGSEIIPNRVRQSIAGDIDSCPEDFYVDVDGEILGLSSAQGTPVVILKQGAYRIDGFFDEFGQGGMSARSIDDRASCIGSNSVVQVPEGVVWIGFDGVYFTDGWKVVKITEELVTTVEGLVDTDTKRKRIQGVYDPYDRRVWWCVQSDPDNTENDACLILDLRWGVRPQSSFTTASGGASFKPTSLVLYNKQLLRADSRGYVLKHDSDVTSDPIINTATAASTWGTQAIIWDYISPAFNFGTHFVRKWVSRIVLTAGNKSNISIQLRGINDDNRRTRDLAQIRFRGNVTWGDVSVVWGTYDTVWNFAGLIEEQRRFPAGSLRCSLKQVQVTNAFANVVSSDVLGTALINNQANTALLTNAATVDWPTDVVGYYLTMEDDGYVTTFEITNRTADTLTFDDPTNAAVSGTKKWVIKGYPKNECLNLFSYTLHYALLSKTQDSFHGETGGNA